MYVPGLNARLNILQAAILIEKLIIYREEVELPPMVARTDTDALRQTETNVIPPCVPKGSISVWAQYARRCQTRSDLQVHLKQEGIPSIVY